MDLEKKSALFDLSDCAGYSVLLEVLEDLVRKQEEEVLKYDIKTRDKDGLLISKCEAYGARRLYVALQQHIKSLRMVALKTNDE